MASTQTLSWSIESPSEIERTARELMRVRECFLTESATPALMPRPMILRSWKRCSALHVDAARQAAPLAVTRDAEFREFCDSSEPLLRAAGPVVDRLADHLAQSGYVVVLTDAVGCILRIAGEGSVRRRLARIDFIPGGDWSEAAAGTNAIGTALADRRPVQLLAAEHFCDGWTDLTCTAVPIHDPMSGEVRGILDVTGDYRLIRAHLTSLLAVSVLDIEERLRAMQSGSGAAAIDVTPHGGFEDATLLTFAGGAVAASLDLDRTLQSVAEQTAGLLHVNAAMVRLFATDRDDDVAMFGDCAIERWLHGCDAVALLRERGEPIIADDIAAQAIFPPPECSFGIRSAALFPLPTARGIIGFVAAVRTTVAHWNLADLRRVFAFMSVAATAIENALLVQSLRRHNRHVEAMNAIAALLGELLDPAKHLARIVAMVVEQTDCDGGALYVNGAPDDTVTLAASTGVAGLDTTLAGRTAQCGRSSLDVNGERNVFAIPLLDGAFVAGVLQLERRGRAFDASETATMEAIAEQIGTALRNARLVRAAGELEALQRADRLKSEFLATVSHELRSPLTAIRASVDGLLDAPARIPVAANDGFLHTIASQATRLGRLVDQLLDISLIEGGGLRLDREWHELPALLADALDAIEMLYGPERIVCALSAAPPLLFVDYDRFIQVLYNLLDNAAKYSPQSSVVAVDAAWDSHTMVVAVADRGPGIAPQERERIFTRFHGSSRGGATRSIGLGLAISRGIVEAHGGAIWVEDRPQGGSVFRFSIPLVAEPIREPAR